MSWFERLGWTLMAGAATVGQRRRPYLPFSRWRALQSRRVRRVVGRAWATVPFYRDAMMRAGLTPGDFRSAEDLARLPLIDREDVLREPDRFFSSSQSRRRCLRLRTTGTSGIPVEFWHDRRSVVLNVAYGLRERAALETMMGRRSVHREVAFRHPDGEYHRVHDYYRRNLLVPKRRAQRLVIESTDHTLEHNVELLLRVRPAVVSAHGSYLGPLLLRATSSADGGWRPAAATYTADAPGERDLERLRNQEAIPVQSLYRSGEALKIGFGCEAQEGLHVHPDLCVVSVVDGEGRPVPVGEVGDIVISNLLNRATVLLNYRIGDRGALTDEPCPCGRSFPRLLALEGRVGEVVRLPDGRLLETSQAGSVFKGRDDVARYQIVQRGHSFEIRVEPREGALRPLIELEVAAAYRRLLGPEVELKIVFVTSFDHDPCKKWRRLIVLPPENGAGGEG